MGDAPEVQKNLFLSFLDQASNRLVQGESAAANSDAAPQVKNSYIWRFSMLSIDSCLSQVIWVIPEELRRE